MNLPIWFLILFKNESVNGIILICPCQMTALEKKNRIYSCETNFNQAFKVRFTFTILSLCLKYYYEKSCKVLTS